MKTIIICVCPDTTQKTVCRHGPQSTLLGFCLFGPLVSLLILFCAAETRTDSLLIFQETSIDFYETLKNPIKFSIDFYDFYEFLLPTENIEKITLTLDFFQFSIGA